MIVRLVAALALALALVSAGCGDDDAPEGITDDVPGEEVDVDEIADDDEEVVEIGEFAEDAAEHVGERVIVRGAVTEIIGERAFVLGDREGEIVALAGVAPRVEGELLDVVGRVRLFDPEDMEDRTGIAFTGPPFDALVGEAVLQVYDVKVIGGR